MLHLTEKQFLEKLPELIARGFPKADPTGMYDSVFINKWMDERHWDQNRSVPEHERDFSHLIGLRAK